MIIYGIRTRESTESTGTFPCPCCRTWQGYRRLVHKRWFTLYFVPVIPLGRAGEQVECQACFSRFSPEVLTGGSLDEPYVAELCGEPGAAGKPALQAEPPVTSPLSITSLILGLVSPVLLCVCGLSLFSSLAAVVTGHMALLQTGRSAGRPGGRGIALTGLVLGYLWFVISLGVWALFGPSLYKGWRGAERRTAGADSSVASQSAEDRLLAAEMRVLTRGSEGVASGNSSEAKRLAQDYSQSLKVIRDALFSEGRGRLFSLTAGEFIVHCERHPGRCAFIVHVPAYRDFSEDAKKVLEISAWQMAQQTVEDVLDPDDSLAVGLRGAALYGAVLVGSAGDDEAEPNNFTRADRETLLAFFPDEDQMLALSSPGPSEPAAPLSEQAAGDVRTNNDSAAFPDSPGGADRPGLPPFPADAVVPPPAVYGEDRRDLFSDAATTETPSLRGPSLARTTAASAAVQIPRLDSIVQQFPDMGWTVESLAFAPNGRYLAAGKLDATLLLLDAETGQRLQSESMREELGQIQCIAFSHDGGKLLAGGYRGSIQAWDVDQAGGLQHAGSLRGHARPLTCLAASPAAPFVLSGSAGGDLVWQAYDRPSAASRDLAAFERPVLAVHLPHSGMLAWATDGRRLIQFDLGTAHVTKVHELGRSVAHAAAFSADGTKLAISRGSDIRLLDTQTAAEITTLSAGREMQWSVLFLPDGERLVSGGRGAATLWDLAKGDPLASVDLGGVLYIKTLAIAQDGSLLAAIPSAAGQTLTIVSLPKL